MATPFRLFDHVDIRVRDLVAVRDFYDGFMKALGLRNVPFEGAVRVYLRLVDGKSHEAVAVVQEAAHVPSFVRIAFAAPSREEVDRLATAAMNAGARNLEGPMLCPEYTDDYYAAFFDDPDGNRLEICSR